MSPTNPLEKCNQYIGKIRSNGFLYFFLTNFTTSNFDLSSISKSDQSKDSIREDNTDEEFLKEFSLNFAVPICLKTVQSFISITRDEYKNAWFVDKNNQVIYFKFRHMCGEGAVKRTYFGWNITKDKPVAVYQINLTVNDTEIKRCLNEKRIAEVEKSPYLLTIHFSTCHRETRKVYMIADFCKFNVKQMIEDKHPWTIEQLKLFSRHILQGLKTLHDMGIIHRDVKPSNIIYDDEQNVYKLIDFGVATKYSSSSQLNKIETINHHCDSDTLSLVGTPGYISPEMYDCLYCLNKNNYTNSVDIFSFGITLLEMFFHRRAFTRDFEKLPESIKKDLTLRESMFSNILEHDTLFLKESFEKLGDLLKTKRLDSLKSEIQEKIDIINQLSICENDEKEMFVSELIDKNKSISYYCKKIPQLLKDLDENTSIEYEFISKMKHLQHYCKKWNHYTKQTIDDMVDDVQMYPLLYLTTSYEIPLSIQEIQDAVLQDFLSKCLDKNPENRLTIDELLQHDWLVL